MWVELKSGVGSVVEDFATLRQTYSRLEEKVSTYQQETNDKILSLRNTLNTLQVLTHILCDLRQVDKNTTFQILVSLDLS